MHEHLVQAGRVDLGHVQADALRVRAVGGVLRPASALAVPGRLRLGGAVSAHRDRALIRAVLERVRASGPTRASLLCTDGLALYARQARDLFGQAQRTGRVGRPRLVLPDGVLVAQALERYAGHRLAAVERRVVRGTLEAVTAALTATQGSGTAVVTTADAERLNATCRARLAPLARRARAGAQQAATLEAGRWLVGAVYNLCRPHRSLRRPRGTLDPLPGRWVERTPAQAAGLPDHRWSLHELLAYPVPGVAPKRRGRRPTWWHETVPAA